MRPTDKIQESIWIDDYHQDKLPKAERDIFEKELEIDAEFKERVETARQLIDMAKQYFLEEKVIRILDELETGESKKKPGILKIVYWSSAALVVIGVMTSYLIFSTITLPDIENDIEVVRKQRDSTQFEERKQAFDFFFEGKAHMLEGQYLFAADNFEKVLRDKNIRPYFKEAAEWNLAICYLNSKQYHKAEVLYDQLSDADTKNYSIGGLNRWKFWWSLQWGKFFD